MVIARGQFGVLDRFIKSRKENTYKCRRERKQRSRSGIKRLKREDTRVVERHKTVMHKFARDYPRGSVKPIKFGRML